MFCTFLHSRSIGHSICQHLYHIYCTRPHGQTAGIPQHRRNRKTEQLVPRLRPEPTWRNIQPVRKDTEHQPHHCHNSGEDKNIKVLIYHTRTQANHTKEVDHRRQQIYDIGQYNHTADYLQRFRLSFVLST